MRIAFVVQSFPILSETFILNQITGLLDRGHAVEIFASKRGDLAKVHGDVGRYRLLDRAAFAPAMPSGRARRAVSGGVLAAENLFRDPAGVVRALNVWSYGRRAASLSLLYSAAPFYGRDGCDVVHCHFGPAGLHALMMRELGLLRGKLVTTFYGYDVSLVLRRQGGDIYRDLFRRCDLIMALSRHMRQKLIGLGCDADKVIIHRIGVDCEKFGYRERMRGNGPVRITSVARLVEKKGIEYGIRAVSRLLQQGLRVEYRVVGDGELREPLTRLVSELGIEGNVKLVGALTQEQVVDVLNDTDIFLLPSTVSADGDEEGVPTGIMEAMAMGLPVVSSFHSGIPELVEDGVSGLLAEERDVAGIADRLARLVAHPEDCREMGRAGRAQVKANFNIVKLNDDLVRIYECLAG
ncbi:MAG: glycosyltransferase [Vicinamibacteria bacterium]